MEGCWERHIRIHICKNVKTYFILVVNEASGRIGHGGYMLGEEMVPLPLTTIPRRQTHVVRKLGREVEA